MSIVPSVIVTALSACTPSSPVVTANVPPEIVTLPFACTASSAQSSVQLPLRTVMSVPALMPLALTPSASAALLPPPEVTVQAVSKSVSVVSA